MGTNGAGSTEPAHLQVSPGAWARGPAWLAAPTFPYLLNRLLRSVARVVEDSPLTHRFRPELLLTRPGMKGGLSHTASQGTESTRLMMWPLQPWLCQPPPPLPTPEAELRGWLCRGGALGWSQVTDPLAATGGTVLLAWEATVTIQPVTRRRTRKMQMPPD